MDKKIKIIDIESIKKDINLINFMGNELFITKQLNNYYLLSRICPHMGGLIRQEKNKLFCPLHNYYYSKDGKCDKSTVNANSIKLILEEQYLVAEAKDLHKLELKNNFPRNKNSKKLDISKVQDIPKINLHSHATLEFNFKNMNILFDPWLDGPAMLGSWRQYPKPIIGGSDLNPDFIIITHQHSDHFHLPTLKAIGRDKLIIFPDFKNGRIASFLKQNNFTNFKALDFEERFQLSSKSFITFYRPNSLFLDSIAFLEKDSFRFLNLNDAGLNPKIADKIGPVHLLASVFSSGASGYPLCWEHLCKDQKNEIMIKACKGKLEMLLQSISMYQADFIMPIASHLKLWLEEHSNYRKSIINNNINDVIKFFELNTKTQNLIPLIPGDSYELASNTFLNRKYEKGIIYNKEYVEKQLRKDRQEFKGSLISWGYFNLEYNRKKVLKHFEEDLDAAYLNTEEEVYLLITIYGEIKDEIIFHFKNGKFFQSEIVKDNISLVKMNILDKVLMQIVSGNISWDEAKIGYWIKWWRNTSKTHSLMTRTMQGPNISNFEFANKKYGQGKIVNNTPINEILNNAPNANEILKSHNLYCLGCSLSPWETIEDASKAHGLTEKQKASLYKQLEVILKSKN